MITLSVGLPASLHKHVRELAERDGISINQFVVTAVAEKMSALLTEEYLGERARRGDRRRFERALSKIKKRAPDSKDRL
jgi:hypothetical protein